MHANFTLLAKNSGKSVIDWIEKNGYADQVLLIAKHLFSEVANKGVTG